MLTVTSTTTMAETINAHIRADLAASVAGNARLHAALTYALEGGKRWRPIIFLAMCESSPVATVAKYPCLMELCLFLEYIHTASLIFDDMPMMDNDDFRRGKPTLHKQFDEATCKLAALQLMLLAQQHFSQCFLTLHSDTDYFEETKTKTKTKINYHSLYRQCSQDMYKYLGAAGLCAGQMTDLHFLPKSDDYMEMIRHKTGSLFVLAFKLGYMVSRKLNENKNEKEKSIEQIGTNFGYLYQILDDIEDYEQDLKSQHNNNYLFFFAKDTVRPLIHKLYAEMIQHLNHLSLGGPTVKYVLLQLQHKWLKNKDKL
jgi:geranylgeranyl pyrophosphate synthase